MFRRKLTPAQLDMGEYPAYHDPNLASLDDAVNPQLPGDLCSCSKSQLIEET